MSTPSALPPSTTAIEPITRAWSRSLRMSALRSVKPECSDITCPSLSGTAAQMCVTPFGCSETNVARRPASTLRRSSGGSRGSSIWALGKFCRPDSS